MERPPVEDAVDGPDEGAPVGGNRGHCEEAHPFEPPTYFDRGHCSLSGDDALEVRSGAGQAAVKQCLKGDEVFSRLVQ